MSEGMEGIPPSELLPKPAEIIPPVEPPPILQTIEQASIQQSTKQPQVEQTLSTEIISPQQLPDKKPGLFRMIRDKVSQYLKNEPQAHPAVVTMKNTELSRRTFLRGTAGLAVGAAASSIASALETKSAKAAYGSPVSIDKMKSYYREQKEISQHPILTPEEYDESHYPEHYWGDRGIAARGTDVPTGGKIWGTDWWNPLHHEDMIFNLPNFQPPDYKITRSPEAWQKIVDHFNLGNTDNARYQPRDGKTFCNVAIGDVSRGFGVWIPHWYNGRELIASEIHRQLTENKKFWISDEDEWVAIPKQVTTSFANRGVPVVMAVANSKGPGHVGIVAPDLENTGVIKLAQAGAKCGIVEFDETHYSSENGYSEPVFMVHKNDYGDE